MVPFVRLWVVIVWVDQQQEATVPRRFLERCLEVQCHALSGALVVAEGLCEWRCFRTLGLWLLGIYTLSCIKMYKAFQILKRPIGIIVFLFGFKAAFWGARTWLVTWSSIVNLPPILHMFFTFEFLFRSSCLHSISLVKYVPFQKMVASDSFDRIAE